MSGPAQTGAAAITGAMIGSIIVWLCTVAHVAVPPDAVAGSLGAIILTGAHYFNNYLTNRQAPPTPEKG